MTGNRRILTRLLTISCQIHIYISLQQTYRIETESSPEKSMYIKEDLSVNNTQNVSPKKSTGGLRLPLPSDQRGTKMSSSPLTRRRGHTRGCGWGLGHQSTSIIQLNTRKKSKHIRPHFLSPTFVDFFCQGFEWFCLDKKISTST